MSDRLLTIDGSQGEGGGQVLRSSLALALVTGRPFAIENIRAGRKKPGLAQQHLTAVEAAAEVGRADVQGAQLGSRRLVFRPAGAQPGHYTFRVGTAGSATLVLQTVLPALLTANAESTLALEGGTHNAWAPPFDFLAKTYLPMVGRLGPAVDVQLVRPGFYPVGGGRFTVTVRPAQRLGGLELLDRGDMAAIRVRALVARLPRHIAQRECRIIAAKTGWDEACFAVEEVQNSRGPGNVVMIELETAHLTEVSTGFGQRGVRAEEVAAAALREAEEYLAADAPVGPHLADQLMLPLGIAAALHGAEGVFRTTALTPHSTTQLDVLRQFLGVEARVTPDGDHGITVRLCA